ncbi:hypothetical protein HDU67_009842 [Dinochytrium kinnereticum]|nr:hypothetical protein HDU67_009842 [Dinochytrium kinnereticum]
MSNAYHHNHHHHHHQQQQRRPSTLSHSMQHLQTPQSSQSQQEPLAAPLSPTHAAGFPLSRDRDRPGTMLPASSSFSAAAAATAFPDPMVVKSSRSNSIAASHALRPQYSPSEMPFAAAPAIQQRARRNQSEEEVEDVEDDEVDDPEMEQKKKMKRIKIIVMSVVGLLLFFATVAIFGVLNSKEGNLRLQTAFSSKPPDKSSSNFNLTAAPLRDINSVDPNSPQFICNNYDLVQIFANVSSIDTVGGTMKLHFLFFPCGKFVTVDPIQKRSNLAVNMNITIDLPMPSQDISTRFARGDVNNYPIETYESNAFQISGTFAVTDPTLNATQRPSQLPVPISLSIVGALQTFSIDIPEVIDVSDDGNGLLLSVRVRVLRSFTTRAFSIFVMGVMWILSILTFCLALSPWIRNYRAEAPTLAIPNTLLFALPAIRNSQPGVPAIGCTADVISFFWCEMLTAVSSLTMLANYIIFTYYPPKSRTSPVQPPSTPKAPTQPQENNPSPGSHPVNAPASAVGWSSRRRGLGGTLRRRATEADGRRRTRFGSTPRNAGTVTTTVGRWE